MSAQPSIPFPAIGRSASRLPVAWPSLPPASAITPYLEEIDHARQYSNFGPLSQRLEARLADHFQVAAERVITVANGTLGLTAAVMAAGVPAGTLALMPAWTFVATAHAARMAGLEPYLVDVEADSGALTPEIAAEAVARAPGPVGVVLPVLPFGQPIDLAAWDAFADRHRLAVVIDAAAGFDAVRPGRAPVMVSLHATKALGVGEGGVMICPDRDSANTLRRYLNFGFFQTRLATVPALNAKLSEYHAAVGLAALDLWPARREAFRRVALAYRRLVAAIPGARLADGYGDRWISSTTVLRLPTPSADPLIRFCDQHGIETRSWWGKGLHSHPAFAACPRTALTVTEALAEHSLGLPCFIDLPEATIERIGRVVADYLNAA